MSILVCLRRVDARAVTATVDMFGTLGVEWLLRQMATLSTC